MEPLTKQALACFSSFLKGAEHAKENLQLPDYKRAPLVINDKDRVVHDRK